MTACQHCKSSVARRGKCPACARMLCSGCREDHECGTQEQGASAVKRLRLEAEVEDAPGPVGPQFLLVVVHTSPSGGVKANAAEIVRLRAYYPGMPILFAGDWYVDDDKARGHETKRRGSMKPEKEEVDEEPSVRAWESTLTEAGMTRVAPATKTNRPGSGSGMVADYFIHDRNFQGARVEPLHRPGADEPREPSASVETLERTLYGWYPSNGSYVSDHVPVLGEFSFDPTPVSEGSYATIFGEEPSRRSSRSTTAVSGSQARTTATLERVGREVGSDARSLACSALVSAVGDPGLITREQVEQQCRVSNRNDPPASTSGGVENGKAVEIESFVRKHSLRVITWNINHLGRQPKRRDDKTKEEPTKRERKIEAIHSLLELHQPHLMVLQEVNDAQALGESLGERGLGRYRIEGGPLVDIDKNNRYTNKEQGFPEYFPCVYDPEVVRVEREGVWDGYTREMVTDSAVYYSSTRPAVVYRVTLLQEGAMQEAPGPRQGCRGGSSDPSWMAKAWAPGREGMTEVTGTGALAGQRVWRASTSRQEDPWSCGLHSLKNALLVAGYLVGASETSWSELLRFVQDEGLYSWLLDSSSSQMGWLEAASKVTQGKHDDRVHGGIGQDKLQELLRMVEARVLRAPVVAEPRGAEIVFPDVAEDGLPLTRDGATAMVRAYESLHDHVPSAAVMIMGVDASHWVVVLVHSHREGVELVLFDSDPHGVFGDRFAERLVHWYNNHTSILDQCRVTRGWKD